MKIFWFTNIMMPELAIAIGSKPEVVGGWMSALLDALRDVEDIDIAVACVDPCSKLPTKNIVNGVTYFTLPPQRGDSSCLTSSFAAVCTDAVRSFSPDIIHVHGTEGLFGLFTANNDNVVPTVISIQGLLHVCCHHVDGGLSLKKSLDGGLDGFFSWIRFLLQKTEWSKRGGVEKKIISCNGNFIGRTLWDKSHVLALNPSANYFYGGELLRSAFFEYQWDLDRAQLQTIFCTAAHSPLKGFHWLLYAILLLRKEYPAINVRVAGAPWDANKGFGYYGRYLKRLIDKYNLSPNITPLPSLSPEEVAQELRSSHVFVIPSLIENSPNSLAEAMLVGTPCVAAYVGGIPSMVDDGENTLCFPTGDVAYLAECIRKIFADDSLAYRLSENAHETALERHNPQEISFRQLEIYRQVIARDQGLK